MTEPQPRTDPHSHAELAAAIDAARQRLIGLHADSHRAEIGAALAAGD